MKKEDLTTKIQHLEPIILYNNILLILNKYRLLLLTNYASLIYMFTIQVCMLIMPI